MQIILNWLRGEVVFAYSQFSQLPRRVAAVFINPTKQSKEQFLNVGVGDN